MRIMRCKEGNRPLLPHPRASLATSRRHAVDKSLACRQRDSSGTSMCASRPGSAQPDRCIAIRIYLILYVYILMLCQSTARVHMYARIARARDARARCRASSRACPRPDRATTTTLCSRARARLRARGAPARVPARQNSAGPFNTVNDACTGGLPDDQPPLTVLRHVWTVHDELLDRGSKVEQRCG